MNDELFDVVPLDERFTIPRVAGQVAAVGAICGALEGAFLAGRVKLLLTAAERVELALGAAFADTVVAFLTGLVGSAFFQISLLPSGGRSPCLFGVLLSPNGVVGLFFLGVLFLADGARTAPSEGHTACRGHVRAGPESGRSCLV